MFPTRLIVLLLSGVLLTACDQVKKDTKGTGSPVVVDHSSGGAKTGTGTAGQQPGASSSALPGKGKFQGNPLDDPSSPLVKRVIYFEFNQSDIKPEMQNIILAHGTYLASNPGASVTLEGHTDERGSREYNVGLGERRAQAVRRLLMFQGATDQQIKVVSYGEEKPAVNGHDETAWVQNRRVEIIYKR
jgi:peptidoglycan-associated lipoprotein